MFVARDARGELVNVLEDKLEKQAYTCPACGGQIHLRQGPSVRTHFAHKSLKDCDFFFENESPEHLANKESLYHWLKKETKVQLEYPLSELKQIADVFVNGNLALEVQCSPLPQKVLKERSEGYRSQGYQVLWLLGQKLWLKERLTRLQQGFLYFSQNMGFYVWELDKEKQVLRLKYLIYRISAVNSIIKSRNFPMVKVVYWKYCVFPIRDKKYLILQFLRTRTSVAISGNNFIIKISFG